MDGLKLHIALTEEDIKQGVYYNIFNRNTMMLILCCIPFIGGLLSIIFYDIMRIPYILCIAFMIYPFIMLFLLYRKANKIITKRKELIGKSRSIVIDDDSFQVHNENEELNLNWTQISEVRETNDLFLCYTSVKKMVYLPKRNLSENQILNFRSLVRNHLSYKKYRLK